MGVQGWPRNRHTAGHSHGNIRVAMQSPVVIIGTITNSGIGADLIWAVNSLIMWHTGYIFCFRCSIMNPGIVQHNNFKSHKCNDLYYTAGSHIFLIKPWESIMNGHTMRVSCLSDTCPTLALTQLLVVVRSTFFSLSVLSDDQLIASLLLTPF